MLTTIRAGLPEITPAEVDDRPPPRLRVLGRDVMELTTVWFLIIAFLWVGYFVLEGFDFGVGMLTGVLGRHPDPIERDRERQGGDQHHRPALRTATRSG